jgi:hypothetical protein
MPTGYSTFLIGELLSRHGDSAIINEILPGIGEIIFALFFLYSVNESILVFFNNSLPFSI